MYARHVHQLQCTREPHSPLQRRPGCIVEPASAASTLWLSYTSDAVTVAAYRITVAQMLVARIHNSSVFSFLRQLTT